MKQLFFPKANRITRRQFWMAQIASFAVSSILGIVGFLIAQATNQSTEAGQFSVDGAAAIPMVVFTIVSVGVSLTLLTSSILVAIKRLHDRDRSGAFMFIVLVPLVGVVWYLVEVGFLAGTPGPNRFGPLPLLSLAALPDQGFSIAG